LTAGGMPSGAATILILDLAHKLISGSLTVHRQD
jgi:hypothetical protein